MYNGYHAFRFFVFIVSQSKGKYKRRYKMKLYKVTTIDLYQNKRVFTVVAKSIYEGLTKARAFVMPHETLLTIEEVG